MDVTKNPMVLVDLDLRFLPLRLGIYRSLLATSRMCSFVSGFSTSTPFNALDTVEIETPASLAISLIVTFSIVCSPTRILCYITMPIIAFYEVTFKVYLYEMLCEMLWNMLVWIYPGNYD